MLDVQGYLDSAAHGAVPNVDWAVAPWAAAQPALHWLGLAPPPTAGAHEPLQRSDAQLLSERMLQTFVDDAQGLVWSSGRLESAVKAIAGAVQGPPEAFLQGAWQLLSKLPLDSSCYELCRDIGRVVLAHYRSSPDWDLAWLTAPASPSQACLRYWTIGVKPNLWGQELEQETMRILKGYPFQF